MRSLADKSLIVISLETYSVVSRLFDFSQRTDSPTIRMKGTDLEITREEGQTIHLNLHFQTVTYSFHFPNNGWISISEKIDNSDHERFNMGFYRDDHNFSYTGEREYCVELCENLVSFLKSNFKFK